MVEDLAVAFYCNSCTSVREFPVLQPLHCHGCTGSLVLRANQETNLVTLEFEIQESDNLRDWVGRPERVTTTLPLEEGKKFVRIALRR